MNPRRDPPIRKDGKCYVCKKPRKPKVGVKTGMPSKHGDPTYLAARKLDPFCSTECCRAFHNQPNLDEQGRRARLEAAKAAGKHGGTGGSFVAHGTIRAYKTCACDQCCAAIAEAKTKPA